MTIVSWLKWKRKSYFRLSQFHDSYLRKEPGESIFEQIMEALYTGLHRSIHSSIGTYTLALAERSVPLWSTPSSPPRETPSWSPASCCRPGRARSGNAPRQCPDSAQHILVKSFFSVQPGGANSSVDGRWEGWQSGRSSRRCTAKWERRSVFMWSGQLVM